MDAHIWFTGGCICNTKTKSSLSINVVGPSDKLGVQSQKVIVRVHEKLREYSFTPMKVAGGPKDGASLDGVRVTIGQFQPATRFIIEENWEDVGNPHERLSETWTGQTMFSKRG